MNGVTTTMENDTLIVGFVRDGHNRANIELVRQYFAEHFFGETAKAPNLLVDLEGVTTLDSSSLSPLVHRLREMNARDGQMAICNVSAQGLREVFSLTRFDQIFTIYPSREAALAGIASNAS